MYIIKVEGTFGLYDELEFRYMTPKKFIMFSYNWATNRELVGVKENNRSFIATIIEVMDIEEEQGATAEREG